MKVLAPFCFCHINYLHMKTKCAFQRGCASRGLNYYHAKSRPFFRECKILSGKLFFTYNACNKSYVHTSSEGENFGS